MLAFLYGGPVIRFVVLNEGQAIKCLTCEHTSWHPEDVKQRFCGYCKVFHDDEALKSVLKQALKSAFQRDEGKT